MFFRAIGVSTDMPLAHIFGAPTIPKLIHYYGPEAQPYHIRSHPTS